MELDSGAGRGNISGRSIRFAFLKRNDSKINSLMGQLAVKRCPTLLTAECELRDLDYAPRKQTTRFRPDSWRCLRSVIGFSLLEAGK